MTQFRDCLMSAVEQGAISREAAADLDARYQEIWSQKRLELGDGAAGAAAKEALEAELRYTQIETRRRVNLTSAAQDTIKGYIFGHRDVRGNPDIFDATLNLFENFGGGVQSIRQRTEAIVGLAHAELTNVLNTFRRTAITGRRMNRPGADDIARELHGQGSGSAEAKVMADTIGNVFEALRQRFNAAGGNIAKLEGWGLPHAHDAQAVMAAGREGWKNQIRPALDPARMRDPLNGQPLSAARLEQVLDAAYDNITSNGWAHREPTLQRFQQGALANQRQEHRFLVFKDADAWLSYDKTFGHGDPIVSVFNHINGMARDIAAMEALGPNPSAMVEWLKQINAREISRHQAGNPSFYTPGNRVQEAAGGSPEYLMKRIDAVFNYQRGRETVSQGVAAGFGTARNTLTSALLGTASLTAVVTDPFIDSLARKVAGLPIWGAFSAITKTFSQGTRQEAVRAGVILDDFLHIMRDEGRFTTFSTGAAEWSKWLADRTLTWSGLSPITQARKHVFALEWMGYVADNIGTRFDALPDRLRAKLEGYGIGPSDWQIMQVVPLHEAAPGAAGMLRPVDIAAKDRIVAEKLLGLIMGETERAVPSGTIRSRSLILGQQARGSIPGEVLESLLQFKSFGLSFTANQLSAIQGELARGKWTGAAYAGSLTLALTIGGGMAIQLGNIINGRDPQPVNDPKFVLAAMQRGGGFGLFGDFMFSDQTRFGSSFLQAAAGPTLGFAADFGKLTLGNAQELWTGKENTRAGREAVNFVRRYTPVASSLWPTRAAWNRVLMDQAQYLADPDAHQAFREAERRFERDQGGSFFWNPGQVAPARAPTLDRVLR
jgi:hypothetical protein